LAAAYLLWLYQRVFFGTVTNPKNEKLKDLTPREILTFAPLIVMAFWIGLYPKPFFQILEQPVNQLVLTIHNGSNLNAPVNAQIAPAAALQTPVVVGTNAIRTYAVRSNVAVPKASN
jgi:NADH-quinone oxidoreductase subunit M